MELVALENITKESIVGLFEAFKVVLEHLIFCLYDLDFTESKLGVQSVLNIIESKNFLPYSLNIKFFDQFLDIFFSHNN